MYAFFEPMPSIEYVNGWRSHVFKCMGKGCKQRVRCYLDKGDAKSTSNMAKHAAQDAKSAGAARVGVIKSLLRPGTITSSFERKSKGKVTYSHRQPNHKAFVAVSVHLEHEGKPLAMVLDVVEVAQVGVYNLICSTLRLMNISHIPAPISQGPSPKS